MANPYVVRLREKLTEIEHLRAAGALLEWDQEIYCPPKGQQARAETMATIAGLAHEKFTAEEILELIQDAGDWIYQHPFTSQYDEERIVELVYADYQRAKKLPTKFVRELTQTCGEAHDVWVQARKNSDFKAFAPILKEIVDLNRRKADYLGFQASPYDALLDEYEPGMTSAELAEIFDSLKEFLVPFVARIGRSLVKPNKSILTCAISIEKQAEFSRVVATGLGYDWGAGRMDVSAHPFSTSMHPTDARITVRYNERDFFNQALSSVTHEVGHALYEQGLRPKYFGTPLGESVSHGIHESQSRMWENMVGKSRPFWNHYFLKLKWTPGFVDQFWGVEFEDFYRALNIVEPSLIRTDADEVTYNLHVILRFEIEKALIEGQIQVDDLPTIWNAKIKEYFGLDVPNDAQGVLQDVHWSGGSFGYFPTYALGNLYSAQFFNQAKQDIPDLELGLSRGEYRPLLDWLRQNIHVQGRRYTATELIKRVTGEPLTSKYFIDYISNKYSEIYEF